MDRATTILIVDDEEVDRRAARRHLASANLKAEIHEARSCDEAARLLTKRAFDCALLDLHLPDGDAFDVLRQAQQAGVTTPILILTGHGDEETAVELMKAGAADYFIKSRLTSDSLAMGIRQAMRAHRAEMRARQAQESLQESEERFRLMADYAPTLIWVSDTSGGRIYFNRPWLEFAGRALDEEVGDGWMEGIHPDDARNCMDAYRAGFRARKSFRAEYRLCRADGRYRWILDTGVPRFLPNGAFAGFIGSCVDITERKQAEEELLWHQQQIEALNARLQKAMVETHHRVRNNLQTLAAMVDMHLMEEGEAVSKGEIRRMLAHIRALVVIHDLLTAEAKRDGEAQSLSARETLEKLLPLVQQMRVDRHLVYSLDDMRLSARQASALGFIVNELVGNALKYSRRQADVSYRVAETGATLVVQDDGPGFPPDFLPSLSEDTGLELVQALVHYNLNGQIAFTNRPEGGARITVTFPNLSID